MFVLILLLVSVVLAATGQLLLKVGVDRFGSLSFDEPLQVAKAVTSPLVLLGLTSLGAAVVFWSVALSRTTLSRAFPFTALTLVLVIIVSWLVLDEPMTVRTITGMGIIVVGLIIAST